VIAEAERRLDDYRRAARATDDPELARVQTEEADRLSEQLTEYEKMRRQDLADEIEMDLL